jgi:hypothetical protein
MTGPLERLTRIARPAKREPAIGRCPVCHEDVYAADVTVTIRGGLHVHRACATYRMRQRSRRP